MTGNAIENPKPKRGEWLMLIIPILISIMWASKYADGFQTFIDYFLILLVVHVAIFLFFQLLFYLFKINPGKPFKLGFYWGFMVAGPYTLHQYLMHHFINLPHGICPDLPTLLATTGCYFIPAIEVGILFAWVAMLWLRYRRKWTQINPYVARWIIGIIISCTVFIPLLMPPTGPILSLNPDEYQTETDLAQRVLKVKGLRNPYFEIFLDLIDHSDIIR